MSASAHTLFSFRKRFIMMKSLQLSRYRAVTLFLASSASVLQAQKNVYITLGTQPETTTVVSAVDRITYADGKANFHSYGKVKSFEAKDISIMGLQERDRLRSERIPFSFQKEFDFDISLADADRTWSVQAEGMPAENERNYSKTSLKTANGHSRYASSSVGHKPKLPELLNW